MWFLPHQVSQPRGFRCPKKKQAPSSPRSARDRSEQFGGGDSAEIDVRRCQTRVAELPLYEVDRDVLRCELGGVRVAKAVSVDALFYPSDIGEPGEKRADIRGV